MITEEQKLYLKILRGAVLRLPASYFDEINPGDEAVSRMFRTAYAQSQAELIYTWFLEEKIVLPEKLKGQLQLSYDHALHRELLMNAERVRIFDFMDEQGIWHCPLKGIQIQPLYPSVGTRYASDNDILVDPEYCQTIRRYMEKRGYKAFLSSGKHDSYLKNPSYHFEMHWRLMDETEEEDAAASYLNRIFPKLHRVEDNKFLYEMTPEDFYLHFLAHADHHYQGSGTGIRYITDTYFYLKEYGKDMDWEKLGELLNQLGLSGFEERIRTLSDKLFADEASGFDFSEEEEEFLSYMFRSGSHGSEQISAENSIRKFNYWARTGIGRKAEYIARRVVPDPWWWKTNYPFLYKYKILIPFFVVFRLVRGTCRSTFAREELRQLLSRGKEPDERDS